MARDFKLKKLNKLLLLLTISPLLVTLIISSLNLNKQSRIRFLIWSTPTVNIGTWLAISSVSSSLITASLAFRFSNNIEKYTRTIHIPSSQSSQDQKLYDLNDQEIIESQDSTELEESTDYMPQRDIRDPSPTISVPFRIVSKAGEGISRSYGKDLQEKPSDLYDEYHIDNNLSENRNNEFDEEVNQYTDEFTTNQNSSYPTQYQSSNIDYNSDLDDWSNDNTEDW